MKKTIAIVLVMTFVAMAATTRQEDSIVEAEEVEPYYNIATFGDYYKTGISDEMYLFSIEGLEPITDTLCTYDQSKLVANVQFAYTNGKAESWDVYLYVTDGIIGTQIVNQQGNYISCYGDTLTKINSNYNVCVGKRLYVYPAGDDLSSFTVVLEHG